MSCCVSKQGQIWVKLVWTCSELFVHLFISCCSFSLCGIVYFEESNIIFRIVYPSGQWPKLKHIENRDAGPNFYLIRPICLAISTSRFLITPSPHTPTQTHHPAVNLSLNPSQQHLNPVQRTLFVIKCKNHMSWGSLFSDDEMSDFSLVLRQARLVTSVLSISLKERERESESHRVHWESLLTEFSP